MLLKCLICVGLILSCGVQSLTACQTESKPSADKQPETKGIGDSKSKPDLTKRGMTQPLADDANTATEITALLTEQVVAWNQGDLEAFMQTYWKSDNLTFSSGGKTTRGWQATLENYRKSYAPPKEMGKLKFSDLEVAPISTNAALVLGQWHLQMEAERKLDGNFSLVLKKIEGNWKIIHDHSSRSEDPSEPGEQQPTKQQPTKQQPTKQQPDEEATK